MKNDHYPFVNLPLPYDYTALEPFIDEKTMHLHHDKHLQGYIDNLNKLLKDHAFLQKCSLEQLIQRANALPEKLRTPIRNQAGGVYNHRFYFDGLINPADRATVGKLAAAIEKQFGSFDQFQAKWKEKALGVFGSGYLWLVCKHNRLHIMETSNQNSPIEKGFCPILNIDVWEHAYYLKHYNVRASYIDDWQCIVNWDRAEERYLQCLGCQS